MTNPIVSKVSRVTIETMNPKGWDYANQLAFFMVENGYTKISQIVPRSEISRRTGIHATQIKRTLDRPGFVQVYKGKRSQGYYYQADALSAHCAVGDSYPREFPIDIDLVESVLYPQGAELPQEAGKSHLDYVHPAFMAMTGEPITLKTYPEYKVSAGMLQKTWDDFSEAFTNGNYYRAAAVLAATSTAFAIQAFSDAEVR